MGSNYQLSMGSSLHPYSRSLMDTPRIWLVTNSSGRTPVDIITAPHSPLGSNSLSDSNSASDLWIPLYNNNLLHIPSPQSQSAQSHHNNTHLDRVCSGYLHTSLSLLKSILLDISPGSRSLLGSNDLLGILQIYSILLGLSLDSKSMHLINRNILISNPQ